MKSGKRCKTSGAPIRNAAVGGFALVLTVALASCYWNPIASTGGISLSIPAAARSVSGPSGITNTSTTARVYLYSDTANTPKMASPIKFSDGNGYKEVSLSQRGDSEISIDGLPVGPKYWLLVSLGEYYPNSSGTYIPESYMISSTSFQLIAGGSQTVHVTRSDVPFAEAKLVGSNVTGVAMVDGTVYATDGSTLYAGSSVAGLTAVTVPMTPPSGSSFSSYSINSLSVGVDKSGNDQLWVNTDHGIVPWDGSKFDTAFSTGTYTDATTQETKNAVDIPILDSGAFIYDESGDRAVFYQRPGGLGGLLADVTTNSSDWTWMDVDLSSFVSADSQPINAFAISIESGTEGTAYFATKLGAFKVNQSLLTNNAGKSLDVDGLLKQVTFFGIKKNSKALAIVSLAFDPATKLLYMGTKNGVYTADAGTINGDIPSTSIPINGTAGRTVRRVVVSADGQYRAYRTDYNIFVNSDNRTGDPIQIPRYVAALGVPNRMWVDDGGTLLVAGTKGIVSISIDNVIANQQ